MVTSGAGGSSRYKRGHGGIINANYPGRRVTCYPVLEHELNSISSHNSSLTLFLSMGSWFLGAAFSLGTSYVLEDSLSATAQAVAPIVTGILLIVSLMFYAVAARAWWLRRHDVDRIIEQCRDDSAVV